MVRTKKATGTREAKSRRRIKTRTIVGSVVVAATIALTALVAVPARAELPIGGLGTAVSNFVSSPNAVAGANNWNCKPSAAHPNPVVLVHATGVNLGTNWVALSPMLANAGYCVFAFNYGMTWLSFGRVGGLGEISASARTLGSFVDKVRASTGASKVDLVGHSQGGMMPNYYIKRLGGASKVGTFVGLAPSNHGTTVNGIVTLGSSLNLLGFANAVLWGFGVPGLAQQEAGSSFQRSLFGDGDTVPGPKYVVIETKYDKVVTPYTNAFLNGPNVKNILIQDQCPNDPVGHVGMFTDRPVLQNVMNVLGPNDPNFKATCSGYGLFL
ncbi:MAG: alpha/beta fold hydrolase [Actinobacteria bacterium]|nr:alpha/beta fold hydrolase [Actinomycetota bacterium]